MIKESYSYTKSNVTGDIKFLISWYNCFLNAIYFMLSPDYADKCSKLIENQKAENHDMNAWNIWPPIDS